MSADADYERLPTQAKDADDAACIAAEREGYRRGVEAVKAAILDIDAHATGMGVDEQGFVSKGYIVTVGALHRALGVIGHTSPKCRLCSPDAHSCATALGALISAAYGWADTTDLVGRARAEERLRDAVWRVRGPAPIDGSGAAK